MKLWTIVFIIVACFNPSAEAQTRRDGNWWQSRDRVSKAQYVIGLIDGASDLTLWLNREAALVDSRSIIKADGGDPAIIFPAVMAIAGTHGDGFFGALQRSSHNKTVDPFLNDVTAGQLADGMDQLYADAANRLILAPDAAWIVLNRIAGRSAVDIQQLIEALRRQARR